MKNESLGLNYEEVLSEDLWVVIYFISDVLSAFLLSNEGIEEVIHKIPLMREL